jgi:hypothetical protein
MQKVDHDCCLAVGFVAGLQLPASLHKLAIQKYRQCCELTACQAFLKAPAIPFICTGKSPGQPS